MADNLSTLLSNELVKQGLALSPAAIAAVNARVSKEKADAAAKSARRTACLALAKFSAENKLSVKDINAGVKAAKAAFAKDQSNAKMAEKTFANFASEAKAAMNPNVRDGYSSLVVMAEAVFKESKADTQIVRDAFKAPAFMVNSIAAKVAKGDAKMPANDAACKAIATKHVKGKAEDVTRCRSAIERIKEKIATEKRTFPLDAFDKMIALCDALCAEDVLENALKAASNAGKLRKGKGAQGASNIGTTLDNLNA